MTKPRDLSLHQLLIVDQAHTPPAGKYDSWVYPDSLNDRASFGSEKDCYCCQQGHLTDKQAENYGMDQDHCFDCNFGNCQNPLWNLHSVLIHVGDDTHPSMMTPTYYVTSLLPDHHDPDLEHFTYGDWTHRTHKFDTLQVGDYIFFNFKFTDGSWRIAAYFRIAEIWKGTRQLTKFKKQPPYKYNAHIIRGDLRSPHADDFRLFVGDSNQSKGHLHHPLVIDGGFWEASNLRDSQDRSLRLGKKSVMRINGSYLRAPKLLNGDQTVRILKMITGEMSGSPNTTEKEHV